MRSAVRNGPDCERREDADEILSSTFIQQTECDHDADCGYDGLVD